MILHRPFAYPSAVVAGSVIGLVLALFWPLMINQAQRITDIIFPVVEGSAKIEHRGVDSMTMRLRVTKLEDCRFLALQAYSRMPDRSLRDAYAARRDRAAVGTTRPVGQTYEAGIWEIWPIDRATGVVLYTQHDCDGRQVSTLLAEVKL